VSAVLRRWIIAAVVLAPISSNAADDILSLDELLQQVKQGRAEDAAINKQREQAFIAEKALQEERLQDVTAEIARLEAISDELERQFNSNEILVADKRAQRDARLGSLKELFGHLTAAAADLRSRFRSSITTSQFPDRELFLRDLIKKMNSDTDLPNLEEIKQVWFEMHRELTESGRVVKYNTTVGTQTDREVVRAGTFNLISHGDYLAYDADSQSVTVLPRQPTGLFENAKTLQMATSGFSALGIDPTGAAGGGFLKAMINSPTLIERWHQGRLVGYVITGIGVFALAFALWRFFRLTLISAQINRQLKVDQAAENNALGRVLLVAENAETDDPDSLELKLGEAILKESPAINTGLSLLKIIAMVAPLLGLLGTVVGMIIVFQAITIYGAGDPKAMAGGISSALVTTVLGLVVAIPTLLAHTVLNTKARNLLHILREQSAGILAQRAGH